MNWGNLRTARQLLSTTFWGLCVLAHLAYHGRSITTQQFAGPFKTALWIEGEK